MADSKGFHKAECSLCNRATWHYRDPGAQEAHCTNHSNWTPGRKRHLPDLMVQGGLGKTKPADPTEQELRIANKLDMSMWSHAEDRKSQVYLGNEEWTKGLFPEAPVSKPLDPDKVHCTFCGTVVEQVHTLTEKKAVIRRILEAHRVGDEILLQEKIISRSETVHACPKCCLNVRKPIVVRRV